MPTAVGTETQPQELLSHLIQLDYDAIAAYELTLSWAETPSLRERLAVFRDDHSRHTERLGALLMELGERPPGGPDSQILLTVGQVALTAPFGEHAMLQAMALNEGDTETAYRRASAHQGLDRAIDEALSEAYADERGHAAWIAAWLRRYSTSSGVWSATPGTMPAPSSPGAPTV
jgi:rubrerythrin